MPVPAPSYRLPPLAYSITSCFYQVEASKAAQARETKIREELEDQLLSIKRQREELLNQKDEDVRELESAMRMLAVLDSRAQEAALRRDDAAAELEAIQSSIEILKLKRQNIKHQADKGVGQRSHNISPNCNVIGFVDDSYNFTEFTLSDLQTATCDFSESFKMGQGGYACVYKGEIMNRSVVIKKLLSHNFRGSMEFQQEVWSSVSSSLSTIFLIYFSFF